MASSSPTDSCRRASHSRPRSREKRFLSMACGICFMAQPNWLSRRCPSLWALRIALPFCALLLASCTSKPPPMTFDLDPSVQFGHARGRSGQLVVYEPSASLPLESRRIVVRTQGGTIAYLHGAQWASDLPSLVQDRLIGAFETAHVLRAVGRPGLLADRSLNTDIQHFEVDVARKTAVVEIYARLVAADGRVITDKMFSATAPAPSDDPTTIAAALSQAFAKVVHDIVIWAGPRA